VRERRTTRYTYESHLDPQLVWAGKAEHTSFDVVLLHIHECISTRAILEAVKKPEPQLSLFGETPLPADQQIEFYQHEAGWANRLVRRDSLLVMGQGERGGQALQIMSMSVIGEVSKYVQS
jgi:adenine-specific DNA-methyltransferase